MNPAQLRVWAAAHQKQLVAGGAGVAVAGGLYVRHKRAAGGTTAAAAAADAGQGTASAATPGSAASQSFTGQGGIGAAYDSSSSDVYNALQPQIEQTQGLLGQVLQILQGGQVTPPTAVTPAPPHSPIPAPKPVSTPKPVSSVGHVTPPPAPTPKPAPRTYTVVRGDNLTSIAQRSGLGNNWQAIYALNRGIITNPNLIYPGQRLTLPG